MNQQNYKKCRILITGASGFIGRYVCRELSINGHAVVASIRTERTIIDGVSESILVKDLASSTNLEWHGFDIIVHLAGRAHVLNETASNPTHEFWQANVKTTSNLIENAHRGLKRFIYISSIGVNGNQSGDKPFKEDDTEKPETLYGISKFEGEQKVKELAMKFGFEYVIIRPALVFGPDAPGNFESLMKLAAKPWILPLGGLHSRRNLLSVWNLANLINCCVSHPNAVNQVFLAADEEEVELPEIIRYLRLGMGKRPKIMPFPKKLIKLAAVSIGKRLAYQKLDANLLVDTSKAKTLLGWHAPYKTSDALLKSAKEFSMMKKNEKVG